MKTLREVYDIKKDIIVSGSINDIGDILKQNPNINNVHVNSDNTIYVESNEGVDSIKESVELSMLEWINKNINYPVSMILNTLPLTRNSCMVKV
jgi:translation initiation factor 2 alpha subunit (eIF-2alpha)